MIQQAEPRPVATAPPMPGRLVGELEQTRRSMRHFRVARAVLELATMVAGLVCFLGLADWNWVLATPLRAVGLAAIALTAVALLGWRLTRRGGWVERREVAEEVESSFPALGQRVRTTLEYVEPTPRTAPAAPAMVRALVTDTDRRTHDLDLRGLVPWRTLRGPAAVLSALAVLTAATLVRVPESRITARRLLLLPAHYTTLDVKPGNFSLKAGGDFTVRATLSGRPVARVEWQRRRRGATAWITTGPPPTGSESGDRPAGPLTDTLKDCQEDLEYRVVAGEVDSPTYQLEVLHVLKLMAFEASVEPPSYTRKPGTISKEPDFQVIEGSGIRFRLTLDREPQSASIRTVAAGKGATPITVPLKIHCVSLSGEIPRLDQTVEYQIVAKASDGMVLEPRTYKIRVQPDGKPSIRFVKPPEELAVIPTAEVNMGVESGDDFGLARVGIVYQVGKGPKETLLLKGFDAMPLSAQLLATLYLEEHEVDYTDGLTYHAFAEDNRPLHPNRATTELRYVDILPFQQTFQLVDGGGSCSGNSATLEELISRQRVNLGRSFAQSEEPAANPEIARQLAKSEEALAAATDEFTRALEIRFGPVPPLHDALAAMQSATSALGKPDLKVAVPAEESALAGLIKARMNLRKLLSTKSSSSVCRKIDRQQQLKLRLPPRKKEDALAKLPQDLKALAEEERQIAQACQNPSAASANPSGRQDKASEKPAGPKESGSDQEKAAETLANRQEKAKETAKRLQQSLRDDPAMSDLARKRMDRAAETIGKGAEALRQGRTPEGARDASSAADQLDRLAAQAAGLKAPEMAAKLGAAVGLAQGLAGQEKRLGDRTAEGPGKGESGEPKRPGDETGEGPGEGDAKAQRGLAEDARTLDDWLARFQNEAADEGRELGRSLARAARENPPGEIADGMDRIADALKEGRRDPAAREAVETAAHVAALAQDLDAARRAFVQPQLDRLVAVEKQAARAQEALNSAKNAAGKAEAEKEVAELLKAMESLKAREGPLAKATEALAQGLQSQGGGWIDPRATPGPRSGSAALTPPRGYSEGVRRVVLALQLSIQELVLRDVLMEKDEGVPPAYKALVDEYYRVLSQDLR